MPVRESEVILGKYLGAFGLLLVIIVLTLANPIAVATLGNLDWGPVAAGYIGLALQGGAMLAVGICFITLLALSALGFPLRSTLLRWHVPPAVSLMRYASATKTGRSCSTSTSACRSCCTSA